MDEGRESNRRETVTCGEKKVCPSQVGENGSRVYIMWAVPEINLMVTPRRSTP